MKKSGVLPHQIPDLLALVADKVDSIPGVPGIGPKTAVKLLNTHGTLENILEHSEELDDRLRTRVIEHRERALLVKKVAILRVDVPINIPFSNFGGTTL